MMMPAVPAVDLMAPVSGPALDDVVHGVLDVVVRLLDTRLAVVSRIESTTCTVMAVVDQHHAVSPGQLFDLHDTFCVHMLESGHALAIDDTTQASMPFRAVPTGLDLGIRSYAGIPLLMADGRVFGSLWTADTAARHFTLQDKDLLQLLARLLTNELDRDALVRQYERIEQVRSSHLSTDPLTGLVNRDSLIAMMLREAARYSRYHVPYAVAVLALETQRSDERSHASNADTLQQEFANILMRTSRMVDCCARIGPNEFAVVFAETTHSGVESWQERVAAAVEAWNLVHTASNLHMGVRIGVADCHDVVGARAASALVLAEQRSRQVAA